MNLSQTDLDISGGWSTTSTRTHADRGSGRTHSQTEALENSVARFINLIEGNTPAEKAVSRQHRIASPGASFMKSSGTETTVQPSHVPGLLRQQRQELRLNQCCRFLDIVVHVASQQRFHICSKSPAVETAT